MAASAQNQTLAPFHYDQAERFPLEDITSEMVQKVTGEKPWELSEDEFVLFVTWQDRYACFISIGQAWREMIMDAILSGEALQINPEAIKALEFRNVREVNEAFAAVYGVHLWETPAEAIETEDFIEDGQLMLFEEDCE
jgi:hypothetical protein